MTSNLTGEETLGGRVEEYKSVQLVEINLG